MRVAMRVRGPVPRSGMHRTLSTAEKRNQSPSRASARAMLVFSITPFLAGGDYFGARPYHPRCTHANATGYAGVPCTAAIQVVCTVYS